MGRPAGLRLLLDTHIFLWALLEPDHLSPQVATVLESSESELWLSPISIWETLLLAEKGRLVLEPDPLGWIRRALRSAPLREAALTHEVAVETCRVNLPHRDPADRFLVATARVYDLTLVTADERLMKLPELPILPNR